MPADCRARPPRYTDKAEESRKLSREEDGAKGRALTRAYRRDLTRDPERSSRRRRTRGVSSEESAGRRLMILARGSKKRGVSGRERRGDIRPGRKKKKKRRGRTYRFLPFAHTDARTACVRIRAYSRTQLRCVGGPVLARECPPRRRGETRPSRCDVQRERAMVSLEIIINIGE